MPLPPSLSTILKTSYPWLKTPLLVSAPMLNAATPSLAIKVSTAGGIGFIAGDTKPGALDTALQEVKSLASQSPSPQIKSTLEKDILPIGVGFQLFGWDLNKAVALMGKYKPAIAWLFAPSKPEQLAEWATGIREATRGNTHIWVQVGTVHEARQAIRLARPNVLVMQGADAGGHGLAESASIVSLIPETLDALAADGISDIPILAAGGLVDGRGMACALSLGASGVVMGTRFLAAREAGIAKRWQRELLRTRDGGVSTTRSTLCDRVKETKGWPGWFDGRALRNRGHEDEEAGMGDEESVRLYQEEAKKSDDPEAWGVNGRMVVYAGTGVGLVKETKGAAEIVEEVLRDARLVLSRAANSMEAETERAKL